MTQRGDRHDAHPRHSPNAPRHNRGQEPKADCEASQAHSQDTDCSGRDRRRRPDDLVRDLVESGVVPAGTLDWVDEVRTIDQVFADIDAEWAALKAEEADAVAAES